MMEKLNLTKNLEHMLIGAERYAFGRRTYIVSVTVDYLIMILPSLSDWCIGVMRQDMKSNRDLATGHGQHDLEARFYGDACDMRDWMRFEAALDIEAKRREGNG